MKITGMPPYAGLIIGSLLGLLLFGILAVLGLAIS